MATAAAAAKANGISAPTGYRKKGSAAKSSSSATAVPAAVKASAAAAAAAAANAAAAGSESESEKAKKTQITYNPDIPMTKEQLTSWRREMRRVRNRESAAASRRKVRDRIEELEEEVDVWKRRYQEVMARLGQADQQQAGGSGGGGSPKKKQKKNAKSEEDGVLHV
ncbi:hypothetical protein ACHAXR_013366 [Thalassiosira sp. AJA248-18]